MYCLGYLVVSFPILVAHQANNFPGQDANKPPQVHHQQPPPVQQGHHQQSGSAQQQVPPAPAQFGGEQAKDEHHIKEHLDGKVDPTANMTPEQLQFHYFNMHDLDKNGKLDGVELIKAITHFHAENSGRQQQNPQYQEPLLPNELELENMIDTILKDDDFNSDGYIDYPEFLKAQKIREENARAQMQQQRQQHQQQQQ